MRIVIVEDDYLQAEWLRQLFHHEAGVAADDVDLIRTESEFTNRLEEFRKNPPALFVIDVMLRWADAGTDFQSPPEEVQSEGFYRAGLRCERLLREARETNKVPVILYTVLEESELEADLFSVGTATRYVSKSRNDADLIAHIKELAAGL